MQFLKEPGLTLFVSERVCRFLWGVTDGGGPMGIGPPELGLLGEDRGIFTLPL